MPECCPHGHYKTQTTCTTCNNSGKFEVPVFTSVITPPKTVCTHNVAAQTECVTCGYMYGGVKEFQARVARNNAVEPQTTPPVVEKQRIYTTGAKRDSATGKGRFDLIPFSAMLALARRLEEGANHYGANNYKKGMPLGESYLNSAARHLGKLQAGWDDEDHAGAVLFNIAAFIETREMIVKGLLPKELDDLPKLVKET